MYPGEEIVHTTASENLSIATGWLFLSIGLGSVLTFTFFAAISTSFYCCQKPIKKDEKNTSLLNERQKLFFPNVPSTVYPTTQSILQQEDNEVVDSLTPAYRELPSTHLSFSFSGSITIDPTCDKHSTILPDSTSTSIHPNTTSISSEQPTIQSPIISQSSSINPELIDDSSLSIHIAAAVQNSQRCLTSSTSGILTEEDIETQEIQEPAMNDQQFNELAIDNQCMLNEPAIKDKLINDHRSNEPAINDQRLRAEICGPIENAVTSTHDCSRGASSFGGVDLNPKISNRSFSPDYYALTFRREGSGLSDVSCRSLRGASAFAPTDQRRTSVTTSPRYVSEVEASGCERGASVFGQRPESVGSQLETGRSFQLRETEEKSNAQLEMLNYAKKSSSKDQHAKIVQSHSVGEPIINSVRTETEASTPKPQSQNKSLQQNVINFPSYKKLSPPTINKHPNSKASIDSYKASAEKDERTTGIASGLSRSQKDNRNNHRKNSISKKLETYNNSDAMIMKTSTSIDHDTPASFKQQGSPITTLQNTPHDNSAPITILQKIPRDNNEPMKYLKTKVPPEPPEYNPNTTYQSLRGASHLGDDDVDSDAFLDSVSLSFAYESPDEEDVASHFEFKGN